MLGKKKEGLKCPFPQVICLWKDEHRAGLEKAQTKAEVGFSGL